MARRYGVGKQSGIATGTAAKTLVQLVAAANHAIAIIQVSVGFHGTNNTFEPIKVEMASQSTAGTMSALTLVNRDPGQNDTLDTSGQHTATVEPTTGNNYDVWTIHPQTGLVWQEHPSSPMIVTAGGRIGLITTAANDVNADVAIAFEE